LIIRVLCGRVLPGQVATFKEQAHQALNDARRHDGLIHAHVGRQVRSDGGEEVVFVSVWRDLEALYGWVGSTDLLDTPVLNSGRPEVFEDFEVQHYETYEAVELVNGVENDHAVSSEAVLSVRMNGTMEAGA
jgi:heme-degrading monooxygenase HmoA